MTDGTGRAEDSTSPLDRKRRQSAKRRIDISEEEEVDNKELLPPKRSRLSTSPEDPLTGIEGELVEIDTCPSYDHSTRAESLRQNLLLGEASASPSRPTTSLALPSYSTADFPTNIRKQHTDSFSSGTFPPTPVLTSFEEIGRNLISLCAGQQAIMKALADHSISVKECFDRLGNQLAAQHSDLTSLLSSCTAVLSSLKPPHTSPTMGVTCSTPPATLHTQVQVFDPRTSVPLPVTNVVQGAIGDDGQQLEDHGSMTPDGLVPED